jgi:hypothetical protein
VWTNAGVTVGGTLITRALSIVRATVLAV